MGTLTPLADRWINDRQARGELTPRTARRTRDTLATLDRSFGARPLHHLTDAAITRWLADHPTWQPSTRALHMTRARAFCRWLLAEHLIRVDPFAGIPIPRRPRPAPRVVPRDDIALLLAVAPDARARLIIHLMWGLGLRCCGVASLRMDDIDDVADTLHVTEKGGHQRRLPLTPEVRRALAEYTAWSAGPVIRSTTCPWAGVGPEHVGNLVRKWMYLAGVKRRPWDGRSAHALRRTACTELAESGADPFVLAEFAGWASIQTASHYVRAASTSRVREALGRRSA